jgi:hypothetical protein
MKLHINSYDLPGGLTIPRPIQVINEKLDLIERLSDMKIKYTQSGTDKRKLFDEMILIELNTLKSIISIDKEIQNDKNQ